MTKRRVFIIGGGGMVGATSAHTLAVKEIVNEIILVDIDSLLAGGQAADINHATAFTDGIKVRTGEYGEIEHDDIVVIACGIAQKPGQTRLDLLKINAGIVKNVVKQIMSQEKNVFILVVSNPVDVLTYVALKESGLPKNRVFGSGTTLDSARLRVRLAHDLHVSQRDVSAYILGEHGDSSFPALSSAVIGGVPLSDFPSYKASSFKSLDKEIRQAAYDIIAAKKSTYYGIGNVVATIVEAMLKPSATILPVCSFVEGEYGIDGVVLGLPSLVNRNGAQIIDKYPLNDTEKSKLILSAKVIRAAIKSM